VGWIQAIALLSGYRLPLSQLPLGRRPDVLLLGPRGVFLGDAKASESASDAGCFGRLAAYLDLSEGLGRRIVAIGTPTLAAAQGWAGCLGYLCPGTTPAIARLSDGLAIAWVRERASGGLVEDLDVDRLAAGATQVPHPFACRP
jgi:hypothetical protein